MRSRRGIMLVYVLFTTALLAVLVGALVASVRHNLNLTWQYVRKNGALYAAEAGIARCLVEMESDKAWTAGFDREPLEGERGAYSVAFSAGIGRPGPDQSINNLTGSGWVSSYRGPNTVPPRCALLVVTGEYEGVTKTIEVLVQSGGEENLRGAAIVSGRIVLAGDVKVEGRTTLDQHSEKIPAGIHSNLINDEPDLVVHEDGSGTVEVSGVVSSCGSSEQAIQINDKDVPKQTGAAQKPIPYVDIESTIAEAESKHLTSPNFATPQTECNLEMGEYYVDGDLEITGSDPTKGGDLTLNNAKLYVKGNLTINGTVKGSGSVFVGGKTTLAGRTSIKTTDTANFVALFSRGRIHLRGNAEAALEDLNAGEKKQLDDLLNNSEQKTPQQLLEDAAKALISIPNRVLQHLQKLAETLASSGKASFVGLLYTNGYVYAEQKVSVAGAVFVRDDGSQTTEDASNEGFGMKPGDLGLKNGARLVYVQEFFENNNIYQHMYGLGVKSWLER